MLSAHWLLFTSKLAFCFYGIKWKYISNAPSSVIKRTKIHCCMCFIMNSKSGPLWLTKTGLGGKHAVRRAHYEIFRTTSWIRMEREWAIIWRIYTSWLEKVQGGGKDRCAEENSSYLDAHCTGFGELLDLLGGAKQICVLSILFCVETKVLQLSL